MLVNLSQRKETKMEGNIRVRSYKNCNVYGRPAPRALSFNYKWEVMNCFAQSKEVYILPLSDGGDKIFMLAGDGHVRMDIKKNFKKDFGTEDPPFSVAYEFYSALENCEIIKDRIIKRCGY